MTHDPIWTQLPSGRMVDMLDPTPADIDWMGDVAPALSLIARFDGACAVGGRPWTVLDHLVTGHDIAQSRMGDRMAQLFLLHDVHEFAIGDISTPSARAIAAMADRLQHNAGAFVTVGIKALKDRWDRAIFAAAGVELPTAQEKAALHTLDQRMLITERNHMMAQPWRSWGPLERLNPFTITGSLRPEKRDKLITGFMERLAARCPASRPRCTPEALAAFMPTTRATGARAS